MFTGLSYFAEAMMRLRSLPIYFLSFFLLLTGVQLHAQYKKRGRNVLRDSTGVYAIGRTKNYKREGKWRDLYPDGAIRREGKYHLGLPEGPHASYWPNGARKEIAHYTNGKQDGVYVAFSKAGDTTACMHFSAGELYGYFYERDTTNQTWMRGDMVAGHRMGRWEQNTGDSLIVCEYTTDKKDGAVRIELRGNRVIEGFYKNDICDSVWRIYSDGELSHEYWLTDGKHYKTDKTFFLNSDSVHYETRYRAPGEPAMYILYQSPGVPGRIEWYSGTYVDSVHQFFPDGKLQARSIYSRNVKTGGSNLKTCTAFSDSGKELFRKYCHSDGTDSVRFDYNGNGVIVRKVIYNHSSMQGSYYYYDNGKLKLQISSDVILAYTENGKRMRTGSKEYSRLFLELDSLDNHYASIQLFDDPYAPESPVSIGGPKDTTNVTFIGYDEPYPVRRGLNIEEVPFVVAEVMPSFPGGVQNYIGQSIIYPEAERDIGVQGTVYVQFVVERDGSVTGVHVVKGIQNGPGLSAEAIRVVSSMPKWSPALQNGRAVRCKMTLPIKFALR